jgi:hypothetical protein
MTITDWLTFLAWEFLAAVLAGMWLGRLRDRHLNRLAVKLLTQHPMSTTPPTMTVTVTAGSSTCRPAGCGRRIRAGSASRG